MPAGIPGSFGDFGAAKVAVKAGDPQLARLGPSLRDDPACLPEGRMAQSAIDAPVGGGGEDSQLPGGERGKTAAGDEERPDDDAHRARWNAEQVDKAAEDELRPCLHLRAQIPAHLGQGFEGPGGVDDDECFRDGHAREVNLP